MDTFNNSTSVDEDLCAPPDPTYHDHFLAKTALGILYGLVFMTAVCGNTLVIYVVASNKSMQSVTNMFIMNLALSDILVNFTSLWLTPIYSYLGRWVWGSVMCHLVPLFQGMSTFISSLTLMAIAIDRYVAILYPFRSRTSLTICGTIVVSIWLVGLLLVMPLAVQMNLHYYEDCQLYICREEWVGFPEMRVVYGFVVLSLQFGLPFVVIAFCYIRIWIHLMYRRSMVVSTGRSASDERRRRRLLKMLVAMVVIYLLAWLPVNSLNVLRDATSLDHQEYFVILFLFAHLSSMSGTCWNPIVYAWMNDNFRREFKAVLPCFHTAERLRGRSYSITTTNGGRRTLASGVANSPSMYTSRHSMALSVDSPSTANPPHRLSKLLITDEAFLDVDTSDKTALRQRSLQITPSPPKRDSRGGKSPSELIFAASPRRSPTGTIMALLTTPTRSKATARLANRKPTGKRIRNKSPKGDNGTGTVNGSSPRRVPHEMVTARSMNGGLENGGGDDQLMARPDGSHRNDSMDSKAHSDHIELITVQTTL